LQENGELLQKILNFDAKLNLSKKNDSLILPKGISDLIIEKDRKLEKVVDKNYLKAEDQSLSDILNNSSINSIGRMGVDNLITRGSGEQVKAAGQFGAE